jgi:hypothetical protein
MTTCDLIGPNVPDGKIRVSAADLTVLPSSIEPTADELIRLSEQVLDSFYEHTARCFRTQQASNDRTECPYTIGYNLE